MSLFGNLLGGGGANVGGLQKKQTALVDRSNRLADMLVQSYSQNAAAGAYDPNAQLDLLQRDNAYGAQIASGNAAAAARTMGYRPGDSAPMQTVGAIGQRAQLDYDRLANQIRTNATDRQTSALSSAVGGASSIYGQGVSAYGGQIQQAMQQQAQSGGLFGSLLGAAMPFLSPAAGAAKVAGAMAAPQRAGSFIDPRKYLK